MTHREKVDRGIYKVADGVFDLVVSAGLDPRTGKYTQVWERHKGTLTSARDARAILVAKVKKGEINRASPTVTELFDAWLADLERTDRAPKTIKEYRADADRYWIPAIGKMRADKVQLRHLRPVLAGLKERGASPHTEHHVKACISSAFSWAKREQWIKGDDPTKLLRPSSKRNARPIVPTPEEVKTLIEAALTSDRPEMARIIWLGAIVGARSSELRALRLGDLDLEAGVVGIDRALSAEKEWTTKNRRIRDVSLDSVTVDVVKAQVSFMAERAREGGAVLDPDAFLFSDDLTGRKPWREDMVTKWFSAHADAHGAPHLTFKHLRKFMDTYGQELGFTDVEVANRAGHDPAVARKHYTGVRAATDRRLSEGLAGLLSPGTSDQG